MSTTVSYKGSTLTTVDNETKTLKTAGKYMEGDVIITDVTQSGGVSITEETDVGGGTIVHINSGIVVSGTKTITTNGTHDVTNYAAAEVNVPTGGTPTIDSLTVTPSTSQQVFNSSSVDGYKPVTVNAMPAMTLPTSVSGSGTGTTKVTVSRSTSDQYINIPTGYNSSAANYKVSAVADGTAGTPTASKGTVSNHSVSVTPSVTNTTGYITGSTKTGTAVTVSASELVSGSETKSANGTYDVTNLASLVVAVPIVTYYTGSTAPSSSLGVNGDIYLQS